MHLYLYKNCFFFQKLSKIIMLCIALISLILILKERKFSVDLLYIKRLYLEMVNNVKR